MKARLARFGTPALLTFWVLLALSPFLTATFRDEFAMRMTWPNFWPITAQIFMGVLCVQAGEILVLSAVLRALLTLPRHQTPAAVLRAALLAAAAVGVMLYHAYLILSWQYFATSGAFMPRQVITLAPILFGAPEEVWMRLSDEDKARLVFMLGLNALGAVAAFAASRPGDHSPTIRDRLGVAAMFGFLGAALVGIPTAMSPELFRVSTVEAMRHVASPTFTLVWSRVWDGGRVTLDQPEVSEDDFPPRPSTPRPTTAADAPPDIYLFVVEGLRSDLITEPEHAETAPFLRTFADGPLSHPVAWANATETSESTFVLLTGQYPLRYPARDLRVDSQGRTTIFSILHQTGAYTTAYLAEQLSIDAPVTDVDVDYRLNPSTVKASEEEGIEDVWASGQYAAVVGDRVKLAHLPRWAAEQDKAVLAVTYLFASHYPYDQGNGVVERYAPTDPGPGISHSFLGFEDDARAALWNRYRNTILTLDGYLEEVVRELERARPGRERVLIFTGDHGELFREHGQVTHGRSIYPVAVQVPILIDAPDHWRPVSAGLVGHVDVAPSVVAFAGAAPFPDMQGMPLATSAPGEPDDEPPPESVDRPLFATVQVFANEDAVLHDGHLFRWSHDRSRGELLTLRGEVVQDPERFERLCRCVADYRARQLRYYEPLRPLWDERLPSRWSDCPVDLPPIEACRQGD